MKSESKEHGSDVPSPSLKVTTAKNLQSGVSTGFGGKQQLTEQPEL